MLLPFQALTVYARIRLEDLAVESSRLPKKAVYMDMLISMDENDEAYTLFNEENMKQYSFDTKSIADYSSEGFVSMSCHYKDNLTDMKIQLNARGDYHNSFNLDRLSNGNMGADSNLMEKFFNENRKFRIALLDENGSIIQLSEPFECNGKDGRLTHYIGYDAINNTLSLSYESEIMPFHRVRGIDPIYVIYGSAVVIAVVFFIFVIMPLISRRRHK